MRRKLSRRSRPLCFAVLLRRMTVFTTCWKRRKKANAGLGGGGPSASHVRTLVGPAERAQSVALPAASLLTLSPYPHPPSALSHPSARSSLFLRSRHTRRLIKSATKSPAHHHRAENGPLTDSPAELPVRPPSSPLLVAFFHPSRSRSLRPSSPCPRHHSVFVAITRHGERRDAFSSREA